MTKSNNSNIFDQVILDIVDYVFDDTKPNKSSLKSASLCLIDSLGCSLEALDYKSCRNLLGPIVEGTNVVNGARVPGTNFQLDPVQAAFNIGTAIRWLDFNDTWLAAEWGHPSDNLGAILSVSDWTSRKAIENNTEPLKMLDVLTALIKAHEIQGIIALENSFNNVGMDHVILVKLASTALSGKLLGLTKKQLCNALSHVFLDGNPLRTYRHYPNTGSRKSWAAGDATSRGVRLALICKKGEMGYPTVLSAKGWGFNDCLFGGKELKINRNYGTYVVDNILFKISYPAEFHAQTAVEASMILHPLVKNKISKIKKITIRTHESAIKIIDKQGPLLNPADRDHCIQYMVSIPLLFGRLIANDYEDKIANNPEIDDLRKKIVCLEDFAFTRDYLDPEKRSIANGITIEFNDGTKLDEVVVEYPIGHKRRRDEGIPLLIEKFKKNLARQFSNERQKKIFDSSLELEELIKIPVQDYIELYVKK
ncbi:MAG: 2-methylcitrate dehydratase [Betaproteobacteria bacterium TMED156]|nr:MAG: 2-methylcitrate dehydratase [Betaproteobacteria bacterium TMED156]